MSGVPQRSVLALLFLIYMNDLPDGVNSSCKISADDASRFSKVYDINKSVSELNTNLENISIYIYIVYIYMCIYIYIYRKLQLKLIFITNQ